MPDHLFPFPHIVLDDFADADVLRAVSAGFDQVPAAAWYTYGDANQTDKRVCFRVESMPPVVRTFVSEFTGAFAKQVSEWTGLEVVGDSSLWGAGLHVTPPGGSLARHVDSEVHPQTGLLRRANAILYCMPDWRDEEGGELELVGPRSTVRVAPRFNRLVLFECGWRNYHGHAAVTGTRERRSIAAFFWSPPRTGAKFL